MFWLFGAKRLRRLGIMGMNRRNAAYILDHNPRQHFPLVDDKLRMHRLCERIGVPTPRIYVAIDAYSMLRDLPRLLAGQTDFVIKPNRGSAGRGVLVMVGRDGDVFLRHNGEPWRIDDLCQHISDILSGMYSISGLPDQAMIQQRVQLHPAFGALAYKGIPDVRVILYKGQPAMAMLRLPTLASNGRANLHQGGIGAGIDLETGRTIHAVQCNRFVAQHPDTKVPLVGFQVPYWQKVLLLARRVAGAIGLGYIGVDIVIDANQGPMLLEANARPGLAIQTANARGLVQPLKAIDAQPPRAPRTHPMLELPQALEKCA
jgi:alpha-L-glutamate ligase-like protein